MLYSRYLALLHAAPTVLPSTPAERVATLLGEHYQTTLALNRLIPASTPKRIRSPKILTHFSRTTVK